jgi:hypothetical protein
MIDPPENIEIEEQFPIYETNADLQERREPLLDEDGSILDVDEPQIQIKIMSISKF